MSAPPGPSEVRILREALEWVLRNSLDYRVRDRVLQALRQVDPSLEAEENRSTEIYGEWCI